jgi:acetyl-CoA acyltransferase
MTLPSDLAAHCITDVLGKAPQLDKKEVEDVILGCGQPHGAQGHNIARVAAVRAGLPVSVAGLTINRFCSSGLNAIALAANHIINDGVDVMIGGGVESITMAKRDNDPNPILKEQMPGIYMVMGDTAEVVAKRYNVTREAQDRYSLLSQQRTARAQQEGFFKEELAPMHVTRAVLDRKTGEKTGEEPYYVEKDECNRADTTLEGLLKLPPHFDKDSGKGSVTAGNSSQLSDGASSTLVMSMDRAKALGIRPKLVFRGFAVAGCEPDEMGIGPVFAIPRLLERNGLKVDDIGLWELNEAFAVQAAKVELVLPRAQVAQVQREPQRPARDHRTGPARWAADRSRRKRATRQGQLAGWRPATKAAPPTGSPFRLHSRSKTAIEIQRACPQVQQMSTGTAEWY